MTNPENNAQRSTDQAEQANSLVEIGFVTVGRLEKIEYDAILMAKQKFEIWLQKLFPQFDWAISLIQRQDVPLQMRQEPSVLLRDGYDLRDAESWDFGIMFTAADLISRYKPYTLAATSNALDLAIISINRLDPIASDVYIEEAIRKHTMVERLTKLCMRCLGHLNGLSADEQKDNLMYKPQTSQTLDEMSEFNATQAAHIKKSLDKIADPRLEETYSAKDFSTIRFYCHSSWINLHEIFNAVLHAKPWEFPFRLIKLSAAALSTMILLMITAETWHLASNQSVEQLSTLLLMSLLLANCFVAVQQRLIVRRVNRQLSEQLVITNVSAVLIVFFGILASALFLFLICLLIGLALYPESLIGAWTNVQPNMIDLINYIQTGMLVVTLGLLIGAMGASFEDHEHFRHVVFVDEEA